MKWIKGLAAFVALVAFTVIPPVLLVIFVGNPIPDWAGMNSQLSDEALIKLLAVFVWLLWAQTMWCVIVEIVAAARSTHLNRVPGTFGAQQQLVRVLLGTIIAAVVAIPVMSSTIAVADTGQAAPQTTSAAASPTPNTTSTIDSGGEEAAPAADTATEVKKTQTHTTVTVRRGDTLWSIAEQHLGSGDRWHEIADANQGSTMADGHTFHSSSVILTGWKLIVPTSAGANTTTAGDGQADYTVKAGDTLSQIASDELGNASAWPAVFEASAQLDQPVPLIDPDLIFPGQKIDLPTTNTQPEAKAETKQQTPLPRHSSAPSEDTVPAPAQKAPPPQLVGETEGELHSQAGAKGGTVTADTGQDSADEADEWISVRTVGGIGAFLAAGVLSLVAVNRRRQQQHRKPGQRIPVPSGDDAAIEHELRTVTDPMSRELVAAALRSMAIGCARQGRALPVIRAARLTETAFELYLAEAVELPEPFTQTADPTVWSLRPQDVDVEEYASDEAPSPYPGLVILGHDEEDAHLAVDLEHVGSLGLQVDEDDARAILAAIAIELATSTWAQDLQVSVVGGLQELAHLDTGRVRHVEKLSTILTELETRAATDRESLEHAGEELQDARVRPDVGGDWTLEVILVAGETDNNERARLNEVVSSLPRVAIASVTAGPVDSGWSIEASEGEDAVLHPFGLKLRPQRISGEDYQALVRVLQTSAVEPIEQDTTWEEPTWDSLPAEGQQAAESDDPPVETDAVQDGRIDTRTGGPNDQDSDDEGKQESVDSGDAADDTRTGPLVRVLGPVMIDEPVGFDLAPGQVSRATELVAFLALHPGVDYVAVDNAMSPGKRVTDNARNSRVGKARRWLGTDAEGADYLLKHQGAGGYRLHADVKTDWALWEELIPNGPRAAGTRGLEGALALVRGAPFAGTKPRYYAWAERSKVEMTAAIVDAAAELARRRLVDGNWAAAEHAASLGIGIAPEIETLWRLRITAAAKAGKWVAVEEQIQRLLVIIEDIGGEMEDETADLLSSLDDQKASHTDLLTRAL